MVNRAGFSLVEAELALVLFAAGLLAIAGVAARAASTLRSAEHRHGALVAGLSVLDSLVQLERPRSGTATSMPYVIRWIATDSSATTRIQTYVTYADGSRLVSDSIVAATGTWPRRLSRVP